MPQEVKPRPSSFVDEEIDIKPSSELIPDEYEHTTNENIMVHIFHSFRDFDQENCLIFKGTLENIGYKIVDDNIHSLEKDNYCDVFEEKIYRESSGCDGLIIFFTGLHQDENSILTMAGYQEISVNLADIWTKFTTAKCPALKNKPKIFIFQVTNARKVVETDSKARFTYDATYETPAEADILIAYNRTEGGDPSDFLSQLCSNIRDYGKSEDIISLVTCTECDYDESRPLIISTLTRKFYFTVSATRGHHHYINENHEEMTKHLKEVHGTLTLVENGAQKKKKSFSFRLRKKSPTKEKGDKKKNNESDNAKSDVKSEEEKKKDNDSVPNVSERKASTSTVTDGKTSQKKTAAKDKRKIPWRY